MEASTQATWQVVGASVVGTSHLHMTPPRPCEDAHGWRQLPQHALALAVADGAGSAARSAQGAQEAVTLVLDAAAQLLAQHDSPDTPAMWMNALDAIITTVQDGLARIVESPWHLGDYATTLVLAIVTQRWIAALHVGDGAIITRQRDGTLAAMTWPRNGEFFNETTFITQSVALAHTQCVVQPRGTIRDIALLTDGIEMIALQLAEKVPSAPFFTGLFDFARRPEPIAVKSQELAAFLQSQRVNDRTDDDKSVLLAVEVDP